MIETIQQQLHISLYHVERASYHSLQLMDNTHPYWALSYVVSGSVETQSRGTSCQVRAGDIMIHPPDVSYSELSACPGTHEWLLLEATLPQGIDLFRLYPIAPVVRLEPASQFSSTFTELLHVWNAPEKPFRSLHGLALTTQLLALVFQCWVHAGSSPRPAAMQTTQDRFARVINYMADHMHEKLSRDSLAAVMSLHPVYFDRLFRRAYGIPPMQMLREMRLQRVRELLGATDDTLEQIASICGLDRASSLARLFQQRFGQTPGAYRQGLKLAKSRYIPFL